MAATLESVLRQAESLSEKEKAKLISELSRPAGKRVRAARNGQKARTAKGNDEKTVTALRAWVDEMEASADPEIRASVEFAERIRERNDRGFKL